MNAQPQPTYNLEPVQSEYIDIETLPLGDRNYPKPDNELYFVLDTNKNVIAIVVGAEAADAVYMTSSAMNVTGPFPINEGGLNLIATRLQNTLN